MSGFHFDHVLKCGVPAFAWVAVALGVVCLAGCSQSNLTPLPDLLRPPADKLLSAEQQKQAIEELNHKKTANQTEAIKQIEQGR